MIELENRSKMTGARIELEMPSNDLHTPKTTVSPSLSPFKNANKGTDMDRPDNRQTPGAIPPQNDYSGNLDRKWQISHRQYLACMLSEPLLVDYFERPHDLSAAISQFKTEGSGFKAVMSP